MNNLGIFLNHTVSENDFYINLHNYNILKSNFKRIIIIDIDNEYSQKLKDLIKCTYIVIDKKKKIRDPISDFDIYSIQYLLKNYKLPIDNHYITFILDKYIYCNNLADYFQYIDNHNLDFCSFTDSTELRYHYQLYLFTISNHVFNKFKNYMINNENENLELYLADIFILKMPYLKVAYINENNGINIYYNYVLYEKLFTKKILPIINLKILENYKNNFTVDKYDKIPFHFNIDIYRKYPDLMDKSDDFLYNHFLEYGQFENRNYSDHGRYILPLFMRNILKLFDLLYLFDVLDQFTVAEYRNSNKDLDYLTDKELFFHWINSGKYENRLLDNI
jgi:hypothetical protein